MRYYIKTFGCQMNVSDSERIAGFLESLDLEPLSKNNVADLSVEALAKADIVVFNTCGVRKMAEDRAYGQIHNLRKKNSRVKIVLTGCLANRKDVQENLQNKVDLFFPINDFSKFEKFLSCHSERSPYSGEVDRVSPKALAVAQESTNNHHQMHHKADSSTPLRSAQNDNYYLTISPKYSTPYAAHVPIMTGCNNFCAYCVVPYARGREVSRPASEILAEIKNLINSGTKEITLLGQNVNSYNCVKASNASSLRHPMPSRATRAPDRGVNFTGLLKKINAIPGDFWIRFMTPHPKDMTDELIQAITSLEKVCEAVHLPLQAGDDTVLARMNRKYTRVHYLGLINKIKKGFAKNKPGELFSLSSDIIVGFPGETKTQLEKTASVMRRVKYDMVFFGQFSPRPGTAAWKLKDNVTKVEKVRREKYLNEILATTTLANNQKYLGQILPVLVSTKKDGVYFGLTRTLKNVKIKDAKKISLGRVQNVKITKVSAWNLEGEVI